MLEEHIRSMVSNGSQQGEPPGPIISPVPITGNAHGQGARGISHTVKIAGHDLDDKCASTAQPGDRPGGLPIPPANAIMPGANNAVTGVPALNIESGTVVSFHYTLRDSEGVELESSRGDEASVYLHGHNNLMPALEAAFDGRTAGDVFTVELAAGEAYGQRDPGNTRRVPVKHLAFRGKLRPGAVVQLNTSEGMRPVTVIKAGRHSADIDTNHPLAGQALVFDIEISELRAATAEELAHGHAHGPGGHQH